MLLNLSIQKVGKKDGQNRACVTYFGRVKEKSVARKKKHFSMDVHWLAKDISRRALYFGCAMKRNETGRFCSNELLCIKNDVVSCHVVSKCPFTRKTDHDDFYRSLRWWNVVIQNNYKLMIIQRLCTRVEPDYLRWPVHSTTLSSR